MDKSRWHHSSPQVVFKLVCLVTVLSLLFSQSGSVSNAQPGQGGYGLKSAKNRPIGAMISSPITPLHITTHLASQAAQTWQNLPLYGDGMTSIVVDPFNAQTIYVGAYDAGVFKSIDGGASWNPARNGLTFFPIVSLFADPKHQNVLYAGTAYDGIYITSDGGENWSFSGENIDPMLIVFDLLFDPVTPGTLYAATAGGVGLSVGHIYKSTNGGVSWQVKDTGMPYEPNSTWTNGVVALAIDPANPATLFCGTTYVGVYRSTDGGNNWSPFNVGLPLMDTKTDYYHNIGSLAIDRLHNNRLAALYGFDYYVFSGSSWIKVNTEIVGSGTGPGHLYFHPTTPNLVYIAGDSFKVSDDGGQSWEQRLGWNTSGNITAIAFHASDPDTIYAASNVLFQYEGGVWKTINRGVTWVQTSQGITAVTVHSIAVDPTNPLKIYVGTGDSGFFYHSTDGGQTWGRGCYSTNPYDIYCWFGDIFDLAIDPLAPQNVYLAGDNLYISNDGGATFHEVSNLLNPTSVAITGESPEAIYVGLDGPPFGVYKSIDGGTVFTATNTGASVVTLATDPNHPDVLWAGTQWGGGILETTDGGDHWIPKGLAGYTDVDAIAVNPANSNIILAGLGTSEGGKIYKSVDGGSTWKVVAENLGSVMNILFDPRDPNWLYAVSGGTGMLRSSDGGNHWFDFSNGIFYPVMYQAAFDPVNPPRLLAGSYNAGLYWIAPDISTPLTRTTYLPVIRK